MQSHLRYVPYLANSRGSIGYYLCLFMQTQFQLGSHIHAYIDEIHSLANLQDLIPTLAAMILGKIKFCRYARECASVYMHWCNYPVGILYILFIYYVAKDICCVDKCINNPIKSYTVKDKSLTREKFGKNVKNRFG